MMRGPIRTLVAVEPGLDHGAVQATMPQADVQILGVVDAGSDWDQARNQPADVLVVVCRPGSATMLDVIQQSNRERPDRAVIVLTGTSPNGFMRKAFEAGAEDVVVADEIGEPSADLQFAMEKAVVRRIGTNSREAGKGLGDLICVLGPKGGIGKTLTTANLGAALADQGHSVAAIDIDLQFGDLGLALGLSPQQTIYDLATAGGSLDAAKVGAYLTRHDSGVDVLLAPTRPEQASQITTDLLREVYELLRTTHDFVLVDTPPGFSPEVIATIDSSTRLCMIGMLDALSLKNTKLGLDTLERMGYDRERIRVVLNRADTNVGISLNDIEAIIGRLPDVLVPSHRDVPRSVNAGHPIVLAGRRSDVSKSFRQLASIFEDLRRPPVQDGEPKRRGFRWGRA